MIIITLLSHFSHYYSPKKLSALPHELCKDLSVMKDSFEAEVSKGNLFTLIKELNAAPKLVTTKKNSAEGEKMTLALKKSKGLFV